MRDDEQSPGRDARRQVFALAVVSIAELLSFCLAVHKHYAWIYPRWFDQDQYLLEAYNAYEVARLHGFLQGAAAAFGYHSPQGALHAFLSLLVFEIAGPSRLAALSINLLGLVALQLASFCAVLRLSRSYPLGWAAVAVIATLNVPWSGVWGSATDFRLDWMASCAFGVALAVGLMGRGFKSTPWACLFGAAVGVALLVRFLTAVYFCGILVVLLGWLLTEPDRLRRCARLLLAVLVAAGVAGWTFWKCRSGIISYYWVGHYGSPEAVVRNTHQGSFGSVTWMAAEILFHQVGICALCLGLGLLVYFMFSKRVLGGEARANVSGMASLRDSWILAAIFFAVPTLVLLTHPEKSEPPADIVAPAALWLVFIGWISLSRWLPRRVVWRACAAVSVAGAIVFGCYQVRQTATSELSSEYRDVNALADFLYFRSQEAGIERPFVAVTAMSDSLNADAFRILGYERHGKMLPFAVMFPTSILEVPRSAVFDRLSKSDFVCVVTRFPAAWPIDRQMALLTPDLLRWCDANLSHDGDIETREFAASIYERKNMDRPDSPVSLGAYLAAGKSRALDEAAPPPAKPYVPVGAPVLWASGPAIHYKVKVAYSPYSLAAVDLPKGMSLDSENGELTGSFPVPGDFTAKLRATNDLGSSEVVVPFRVVAADWTAEVGPPEKAATGVPTKIDFTAFDARGTLDFIDITDLTESKVLARLEARDDERVTWQGSYRFAFGKAGPHQVIVRTVRYDPKDGTYTYIDREFTVAVAP